MRSGRHLRNITMTRSTGTSMRAYKPMVRFVTGCGKPPIALDVTEVRRLLRTNKGIGEIAEILGIDRATLCRYVKRMQICNLKDRAQFIRWSK